MAIADPIRFRLRVSGDIGALDVIVPPAINLFSDTVMTAIDRHLETRDNGVWVKTDCYQADRHTLSIHVRRLRGLEAMADAVRGQG